MRANDMTRLLAVFVLVWGVLSCTSQGNTRSGTEDDPAAAGTAASVDEPGPGETDETGKTDEPFVPTEGGEGCQFDEEKIGNIVGKHIDNYTLKTYQGDAYSIHQECGKKKALWVILSTGW